MFPTSVQLKSDISIQNSELKRQNSTVCLRSADFYRDFVPKPAISFILKGTATFSVIMSCMINIQRGTTIGWVCASLLFNSPN